MGSQLLPMYWGRMHIKEVLLQVHEKKLIICPLKVFPQDRSRAQGRYILLPQEKDLQYLKLWGRTIVS